MNADRANVARLCVNIFEAIDRTSRKEEALMALAAAFVILVEVLKVKPTDVLPAVQNLMVDASHPDQRDGRFAAMKYYLEEDVVPYG